MGIIGVLLYFNMNKCTSLICTVIRKEMMDESRYFITYSLSPCVGCGLQVSVAYRLVGYQTDGLLSSG
jgi:hypothetical protein